MKLEELLATFEANNTPFTGDPEHPQATDFSFISFSSCDDPHFFFGLLPPDELRLLFSFDGPASDTMNTSLSLPCRLVLSNEQYLPKRVEM